MKRTLTWLIMGLLSASLFAAKSSAQETEKEDSRNPLGCRDMGYKYDLKILKLQPEASGAERQTMYFIYNRSPQVVNLYHMRGADSLYNVFMNHAINAKQWAVLSTSESEVKFICSIPDGKSKYGKIVDCSQNLKVCEFNNVVFGLNNRGNFWIVNSNTRNGALRDVVHYGIIPAS